MTKVSYLAGRSSLANIAATAPAAQAMDIPGELAAPRFIDPRELTVGQMNAALLAEQLNILEKYYGLPELTEARTMAENALYNGLHDYRKLIGKGDEFTRMTAKLLQENARKRRPADKRRTILQKPSTVGALIPMEDCDQYMDVRYNTYGQYDGDGDTYTETVESLSCRQRNKDILLLNQKLEPSSHHLLYEFLTNPNSAPALVGNKYTDHRNAVSALTDIFEFDRDNMRQWLRNGVMRNNLRAGAGPKQAEASITILKEYAITNGEAGVGAVPLAIAIIGAITAAVGAIASLVGVLNQARQQRILSTAQGIGTTTFGPEELDWYGTGGGNNGGTGGGTGGGNNTTSDLLSNEDLPLYLGLGGAALLLLNSK